MSTSEIRDHLQQAIDQIDDPLLLNDINEFIEDVISEEEKPLTDDQKVALDIAIQQGLKDFEDGRSYTFEEFKKRFPEWPIH